MRLTPIIRIQSHAIQLRGSGHTKSCWCGWHSNDRKQQDENRALE